MAAQADMYKAVAVEAPGPPGAPAEEEAAAAGMAAALSDLDSTMDSG